MPYEVVKRVGARAYRYRVESYRDPESRKVRARWTYLGRLEEPGREPPPPAERRAADTRERLLDAFEALLETVPYQRLTASAVARRASLAQGTFYRYFSDKHALLTAAVERVRQDFVRSLPSFEAPYGDADAERSRVRTWVARLLTPPAAHFGTLRAYLDALETDAALREHRAERLQTRARVLQAYLAALHDGGTIDLPRPNVLAAALLTLVDATLRSSVVGGGSPRAETIEGVCDVFERSIFR